MKALFADIRAGNLAAVTARLDADETLLGVVAKAPPKKDDGQSPLQVAIKSAQFEVALLLLARGADVNFIDASAVNRWNTPVLHDAIRAAVFSSRFGRNRGLPGEPPRIEIMNSIDEFDRAFGLLREMVKLGADPNAPDSFGNPALMRGVLDARQVVGDPIPDDLAQDLHRIFDLLLAAGADPGWVDARRNRSLSDDVAGTTIEPFLRGG